MTGQVTQLRADARDNRDRILAAAREVFAADGLDVPMRAIARRAGVGPATLYRRFPTKEALITEAFAGQLAACERAVEEGGADPDPWRGLCRVIERVCAIHAQDKGFSAAFVSAYPRAVDLAASRDRSLRAIAALIRRAKTTGKLRADFTVHDLVLVLLAQGGIRTDSPERTAAASRRFAALVIQGLAPTDTPTPPPVRLPIPLDA